MKKGIYQHYKGNYYKVICTAKHSETEEEMVVYQCLYGDHNYWVRPLAMFEEEIEIEGKIINRFQYIKES